MDVDFKKFLFLRKTMDVVSQRLNNTAQETNELNILIKFHAGAHLKFQ